jgi:hypothetical protein
MNNKLADLRSHLFATREALADPDKPMKLARAKTIAEVGLVLVGTAKVKHVSQSGWRRRLRLYPGREG